MDFQILQNQQETNILKKRITNTEIKRVTRRLPTTKNTKSRQIHNRILREFQWTTTITYGFFFNKSEKEGALRNLLYKASIIPMPKPGEITMTKKTISHCLWPTLNKNLQWNIAD